MGEAETLTALLLAAVFAPVVSGLATLALPTRIFTARVLTALAGPAASVYCLATVLSRFGTTGGAVSVPFIPSINCNIDLIGDPLSVFFGLLVSGIGCLIVLYARGYFGRDEQSLRRFYPTLGFFATAMMGIVLSDSTMGLFLFWELTSVSSFLLIGWDWQNPKAVRLAVQAFVTTGLGGLALLAGVILLGTTTGEWTVSGLLMMAQSGALYEFDRAMLTGSFVLLFIGAGAKSAQFPLHFWLPGAMAAPTPVSAYLHSATMVKAGVFLLARVFPVLAVLPIWAPTLVGFGATTMVLGAYLALRSAELKKIFAYTTVSQLGLLVCAYGLGAYEYVHDGHGEQNLIWPVMQILNHAAYKAPLFIIAGAIMHLAGRKELHQLKGLIRTHPVLAVVALLAAYGLAGGPFTLSFTAKEAFLYQIVHAAHQNPMIWIVGGLAVFTAMCNVAIFVRMATTFFAAPKAEGRISHGVHSSSDNALAHDEGHSGGDPDRHVHEGGFWGACIWLPAAVIVSLQYVGGFAPAWFGRMIERLETHTLYWHHLEEGSTIAAFGHLLHGDVSPALLMSLIAIAGGVVLGLSPLWRTPVVDVFNGLFPGVMRLTEWAGFRLFHLLQTGNLRHYVFATLGALLVGVVAVAIDDPGVRQLPKWAPMGDAGPGITVIAVSLTVLICMTSLIMPWTSRRVVRVLVMGACGFSVTGMYLIYQAPDLALTQLMFEIISVILFMLVLRLLPEEHSVKYRISRTMRAVFAGAVGLVIGWTVLHGGAVADQAFGERQVARAVAHESRILSVSDSHGSGAETHHGDDAEYDRLGPWFERHANEGSAATDGRGGGGNNIVNVILVDFRGYDTLGELTVLSIAVIGVLSMLASAPGVSTRPAGEDPEHNIVLAGPQPRLRSSLLQSGMCLLLPLMLIFAGYMFFKGHNEPGGGFIAGLVAAVALAVYRMAEGREALRRMLPLKPGTSAALGLTIALITATMPLAFGLPLLTSVNAHIPLPGDGDFHFASAMFFDIGVFIVVVGASVGMINRFEEELE
jgi:multicomponent K+:H+ antiporter subunit A